MQDHSSADFYLTSQKMLTFQIRLVLGDASHELVKMLNSVHLRVILHSCVEWVQSGEDALNA